MSNADVEVKRAYEEILNRATKNVKWKDLIHIKSMKSYVASSSREQ